MARRWNEATRQFVEDVPLKAPSALPKLVNPSYAGFAQGTSGERVAAENVYNTGEKRWTLRKALPAQPAPPVHYPLPPMPEEIPTPAPVDSEPMGPPNLGPSVQAPPSALPFDDRYIKAARSDYDTRRNSINDILSPIQQDREQQLYRLRSGEGRNDSGLGESGRAMKSALTLNMIQGYEGDQADIAKSRASGIGALDPSSLMGTKYGMGNKEASERALFEESLPSKQSAIELQKAQAAVAKHAALPENLTSKADLQKEKLEAHARELGAKAYQEAMKTKTPEEALDMANSVMWQAMGKEFTPSVAGKDVEEHWYGNKPAIPAIPARLKQADTSSSSVMHNGYKMTVR